jgi:nicotinamidase-related amidase
LNTPEGKKLPIEHCIEGTSGWCINEDILRHCYNFRVNKKDKVIYIKEKNCFCLFDLIDLVKKYDKVYFAGVCTDICVISNALLIKNKYPDKEIYVYDELCAGSTPEAHEAALLVMKNCQIDFCRFIKLDNKNLGEIYD